MKKKLKQSFITLILLADVMFAANIPSSGTILNEIKPSLKQIEKKAPVLPAQEFMAPISGDDIVKVFVKKFEIENNTVFSAEVLHELIQEYEGKELTIVGIKKVADIISKYYRKKGYFVARAYIPAQDLNDNIVKIAIIEGIYGVFHIKNSSNIDNSMIERYLSKFDNQNIIYMDDLERQIFLINSLSGLQIVDAQIQPGQMVGSSDFVLTIEASEKFNGYVTVDNYGNKFTGNNRASIGGTLNSPFGYGDALTIYILNSFSNELKYGNLSYNLPISDSGMIANVGASRLKYKLGDSYKAIDAYGDATVLEAGISYPIIKNSSNSLVIKGEYSHRVMSDWMSDENDRKSIDDFTLSLQSYNNVSLFELPASLSSMLSFTHGNNNLKSQTAAINDSIVQTAGNFSKANLNLTHNLQLNQLTALRTIFNTQTGFNRNLYSSHDLSVGGAYGLRAYGDNELSGDKGYLFSVEFLRTLPTFSQISHQVGIFYDTAKIWSNINTWDGLEDNTRRLNDVGISYTLMYKDISLKASYAHGFGSEATPVSGVSRDKLFGQLFLLF